VVDFVEDEVVVIEVVSEEVVVVIEEDVAAVVVDVEVFIQFFYSIFNLIIIYFTIRSWRWSWRSSSKKSCS
jgi:hypothetical protein